MHALLLWMLVGCGTSTSALTTRALVAPIDRPTCEPGEMSLVCTMSVTPGEPIRAPFSGTFRHHERLTRSDWPEKPVYDALFENVIDGDGAGAPFLYFGPIDSGLAPEAEREVQEGEVLGGAGGEHLYLHLVYTGPGCKHRTLPDREGVWPERIELNAENEDCSDDEDE